MAKAVRLADIAERFGVSTVTVSKALSGQKGVSEELREKIVTLADELGYQPRSAQSRKEKTNYNIGVLIAQRYLGSYDNFYMQMYQQIVSCATAQACFTVIEIVSAEAEEQAVVPMLVQKNRAEGLIVLGKMQKSYLENLKSKTGRPLIYLDFSNEEQDVDAVISDNYYGAYQLTNYLFDMGHTKIGYVGTLLATASITDRYLGYVRALMEHGVAVREEWVIDDRDIETGEMYREGLSLPGELPTAFFCNCDLAASILVRQLGERGLKVPADISVAGYDNYLFTGLCEVELTSYEVDMKEMARRAIRRLVKKMDGEVFRPSVTIVEGRLIPKESVKKLSGS